MNPTPHLPEFEFKPHLLTSTEQMVPVVLGLRELRATACVLCETNGRLDAPARAAIESAGVTILNDPGSFVLTPTDVYANAPVVKRLKDFLTTHERCRDGVIWNYGCGTKPMAISLDRYLDVGFEDSPVLAAFYIDTRETKELFIDGRAQPLPLQTRLTVSEVLQSNGWMLHAGYQLSGPLSQLPPAGMTTKELRDWLQLRSDDDPNLHLEGPSSAISLGVDDVFTIEIAHALAEHGPADDLWLAVKTHPIASSTGRGDEQDLDIVFTCRNTIVVVECKATQKNQGDAVLKAAQIARRCGGTMGRPAYVGKRGKKNGAIRDHGIGRKAAEHKVAALFWDPDQPAASVAQLIEQIRLP